MFPTSSRTLFVGTNARSATARTTVLLPPRPVRPQTRPAREAYANSQRRTNWQPSPAGLTSPPAIGAVAQLPWYVPAAVSRRTASRGGTLAAVAALLALAGCGGGARQDAQEPSGNFTVSVPVATFPASQRLAQHTQLVIAVRNTGTQTIPDVAVTIIDANDGGIAAQAFGHLIAGSPGLASRSRPVWIIDHPPGPCQYSCRSGGPGGAVTADTNTWALGALKPRATARFDWGVTAIKAGTYVIRYQVAAGLNGKAKAVLAGGGRPGGTFTVTIHSAPQQAFVNDKGQVVRTP